MAASVQFRQPDRDLGMVMRVREVDENLAIFLGIKNIESKADPKSERIEAVHDNQILYSEIDTNGHDWLIAPPPVNDSPKNPDEFSRGDPRKPEINTIAKRKPLTSSLSGDRKVTTTPKAVLKPKPSRSSTPNPTRSAFPSSKTRPSALDSIKTGPTSTHGPFQSVKSRPSKTDQITKTSRRPASAPRGRSSYDEVNPVEMGTKMVERVVNMRKLAPPKKDEEGRTNEKKKNPSSRASSGFGRSMSNKSLDMAIRHMGIKGSVHDGLSSKNIASSSESSKSSNGSRNSCFLDGGCMD